MSTTNWRADFADPQELLRTDWNAVEHCWPERRADDSGDHANFSTTTRSW